MPSGGINDRRNFVDDDQIPDDILRRSEEQFLKESQKPLKQNVLNNLSVIMFTEKDKKNDPEHI